MISNLITAEDNALVFFKRTLSLRRFARFASDYSFLAPSAFLVWMFVSASLVFVCADLDFG